MQSKYSAILAIAMAIAGTSGMARAEAEAQAKIGGNTDTAAFMEALKGYKENVVGGALMSIRRNR